MWDIRWLFWEVSRHSDLLYRTSENCLLEGRSVLLLMDMPIKCLCKMLNMSHERYAWDRRINLLVATAQFLPSSCSLCHNNSLFWSKPLIWEQVEISPHGGVFLQLLTKMAAPTVQHFSQYHYRLSWSWPNSISGYLSYSWMKTQNSEVVADQQKTRIINYTKEMLGSIFSSKFRYD